MPQSLPFEHAISQRLFLLYGSQQFGFVIGDKNGEIVHLKHYVIEDSKMLSNIIESCPELNEVYSKTELISMGNDFILIPEVLALNNRIDLFQMSFNLNLAEHIIRHCGTTTDAEVCFAMDAHAYYLIKEKFPNHDLHQEVGIILDWLMHEVPADGSSHLCMNISGQHLVIFAMDAQKNLLLCNRYPFSTMDELHYWLTFIPDQLGFKGANCSLGLIGSHPILQELRDHMAPFFKHIYELPFKGHKDYHAPNNEANQWMQSHLPLQLRSMA